MAEITPLPEGSPCPKCGREHPRCSAHARHTRKPDREAGAPCLKWPARGGTVCSKHGGSAPQVKLQNRQRLALAEAAKLLGAPTEIAAVEALQHVLWIAYRDLAFWRGAVDSLDERERLVVRGAQGASMAHVYVKQYNDAQERTARFAKLALDAGIEERQVRVLEEQATMVAEVGRRFVAKVAITLGLSREQAAEIRDLFRRELAVIESPELLDLDRKEAFRP